MTVNSDQLNFGSQYKIEEQIAEGCFSKVFGAQSVARKVSVAIKVLGAKDGVVADSKMIKRFQREGRALAQLTHPIFARAYDFGVTPQGLPYLVMELFEGDTLETIVAQEGPLQKARFQSLFSKLCDGLEAAHKGA